MHKSLVATGTARLKRLRTIKKLDWEKEISRVIMRKYSINLLGMGLILAALGEASFALQNCSELGTNLECLDVSLTEKKECSTGYTKCYNSAIGGKNTCCKALTKLKTNIQIVNPRIQAVKPSIQTFKISK